MDTTTKNEDEEETKTSIDEMASQHNQEEAAQTCKVMRDPGDYEKIFAFYHLVN